MRVSLLTRNITSVDLLDEKVKDSTDISLPQDLGCITLLLDSGNKLSNDSAVSFIFCHFNPLSDNDCLLTYLFLIFHRSHIEKYITRLNFSMDEINNHLCGKNNFTLSRIL